MAADRKIALCLTGGGPTGAMFQIGALAALEDAIEGFAAHELSFYVGTSSGASVAATLAGGRSIQRIYRAFLDPADVYFSLERKHLMRFDLSEWRRTFQTGFEALRHATASLWARLPTAASDLREEIERLEDSMPAGFLTLDAYERFLEDFFVRRGVPNNFHGMPRPLVVIAYDLDTGAEVKFGSPGFDSITVTRACIASSALPPFFSPVRIGERHYIDPGAAPVSHFEVALEHGADTIVCVNPMVPVSPETVPTGHGRRSSVRDKGLFWVSNQSLRIGVHHAVHAALHRERVAERATLLLVEPTPEQGHLFMYNPSSYDARRRLLEYAYRSTRALVDSWFADPDSALVRAGFRPNTGDAPSSRDFGSRPSNPAPASSRPGRPS
jgi:predicted acylesterase/phospholipase RssA